MKLALPLIFNVVADHTAKCQAVKERESRAGCYWAGMWELHSFPLPVPGLSSWGVRWVGQVGVSSPSLRGLSPAHFITVPALLAAHSAQTLLLGSWEAFPSVVLAGFGAFFLLCCHMNGSEKLLGWGFFHMKEKKKSLYLEIDLDAVRIPGRSEECWLESIIDLLWSKWSENFVMSGNMYSVLTRQITFALEN